MGLKRPEASVEVPVPLAALGPLARAIFEHARRPPSRRGRGPLQLEIDVGAQWKSTQLQLDMPEDIAWLLQLHQLRPDNAYGCAVLEKGKASNNNMLILSYACGLSCLVCQWYWLSLSFFASLVYSQRVDRVYSARVH